MNPSTVEILLELNRRFYQTFAGAFSATRGRAQPGVRRIVAGLRGDESILDLGCGNGTLAGELAAQGKDCVYLGLDASARLLEQARQRAPAGRRVAYLQADLAADWDVTVRRVMARPFDLVTAFAVLHHLPGADLRRSLLRHVRALLALTGQFIHSEWQFLRSPRLRGRIVGWEAIGLHADDVDPGDALLDWRAGGRGLRYVHHFTPEELEDLAAQTGFRVRASFLSDGAGGDLSLYQVWEPAPEARGGIQPSSDKISVREPTDA